MSKFDELLDEVADKLDHAADVITEELERLKGEIAAGQPTEATLSRLQAAAERIHGIVDHDLVEDNEHEEEHLEPEDKEMEHEE